MAQHFKDISSCPICLHYLENPMYLKCGYVCCQRCTDSLEKDPEGEGLLCPHCSVVSEKENIVPALQLGRLISKIKKLEPQLRYVLQMNPMMRNFQVDMTLDVNTANNYLVVSDDLRNVHHGSDKQRRKKSAERFRVSACVLGSSWFTSGRYYWEVVVGTSKEWDIGICKQSSNREKPVVLSEKHGFWTVGLRDGDLYAASTEPMTQLYTTPGLHRVGVFLDLLLHKCISFWDVRDGSHIFTFVNISDEEPLRPFFAPARPFPDNEGVLSICPVMNPAILKPQVSPEQGR